MAIVKKKLYLLLVKAKYKITISFFLLAVVLFAAVPKVYVHSLLGHNHKIVHVLNSTLNFNEEDNTTDCNFEKFDTPVYYSVFKFIVNFSPLNKSKQTSFLYHQDYILKLQYNVSLLRAPPVA